MSESVRRFRPSAGLRSSAIRGAGWRHVAESGRRVRGSSRLDPREVALATIQQAIVVFNRQQRLEYFNDRYAEIYGLAPSQLRIGMSLREVIGLRYAAGTGPKMSSATYRTWLARLVRTAQTTHTELTMENGSVYSLSHHPTKDGGFIGTFTDVTDRRRAESRIEHMAHHDGLTGVANRTLFFERLDAAIRWMRGQETLQDQRAARTRADGVLGVMYLDLDRFKDVNDTIGHAAGDLLLLQAAQRIGGCLRATDLLARLGGDEFAVILDRSMSGREDVETIARQLLDVVARPFALQGHEVVLGTTIGFTTVDHPAADMDAATLLSQADLALNHAKSQERGTVCAYVPEMSLSLARRTELERDLRRAIGSEALSVHFQPMHRLADGKAGQRIIGAEALVRWKHPRFGMVSPAEFIPVAESSGLITALGGWVLRNACMEAVGWGEMTVAVNLSPEQLRQPDLVEMVVDVLRETGLPPGRLELEVTEGLLLRETEGTATKLLRLRGLGIGIALDDFGTGYSSLSYLRRFPFSKLKIDRSFIAAMCGDEDTRAIVRAIASLGRSLNMVVIAEGIETDEQLDQVRLLGCDQAQGYLLGKPCPAAAFERLIAAQAELAVG